MSAKSLFSLASSGCGVFGHLGRPVGKSWTMHIGMEFIPSDTKVCQESTLSVNSKEDYEQVGKFVLLLKRHCMSLMQ